MNDGCCPLAVATTDNIALIASGASMESSNTYVGKNEMASFLKQGYSLSASRSTEEEWFSASTREAHEMGMNFSSPTTLRWCADSEKLWELVSHAQRDNAMPSRTGVGSPEWSCRGQCPSGLEELPRVLECLEPWSLSIHPAVLPTHIYGVPVCSVSSAYRGGDQARVWMEGEPRTELCRELRLRGLWEVKYSCLKNEWAITSVPAAEMSSTRCLESTYWEWHTRLGHRHKGCLVEGVYMHCEWVEWWVEDGEDFLTVHSGREMGAAARRWLRLEKEGSCRYLMTSAVRQLTRSEKRRPSSLTLMENSM